MRKTIGIAIVVIYGLMNDVAWGQGSGVTGLMKGEASPTVTIKIPTATSLMGQSGTLWTSKTPGEVAQQKSDGFASNANAILAEARSNMRQYDAAVMNLADTQNKAAEAARKATALKLEKERKLEDYRTGQFCSGCGKFRSQFAPGETFPHSGQHVVIPTYASGQSRGDASLGEW